MKHSDKVALFIDGQNFYFTAKNLGFDIDYRRLLEVFSADGNLVRAYFYTTVTDGEEFQSVRPLVDWLDYNGFTVRAKNAKEFDDGEGRRKYKRSIGVELSIDAMELAKYIDRAVIFSGDGEYRALVEALQRRGVHVSVVSTTRTKPAMIADELRRQADAFLELEDLRDRIGRTAPHSTRAGERKVRSPATAVE